MIKFRARLGLLTFLEFTISQRLFLSFAFSTSLWQVLLEAYYPLLVLVLVAVVVVAVEYSKCYIGSICESLSKRSKRRALGQDMNVSKRAVLPILLLLTYSNNFA